ncbi:PRC-barrel domain-containing protein [Dapis sp. BLCC M126]|uniref:PRC-barrel domain-containing protein n=1 Tax=Dapis sp. BLCC M126 TaxID=3400189 RepID=UPI003CF8C4C8
MNQIPEVIKHSQLLNRLVLDRETVEDQGCIEELCLDPQSHQVIGFICKSGLFRKQKKYFAWKQIETIGADATLVNGKPQPDNLEKHNNIVNIIGNEVWTDTGEKVGFIVEYLLNIKTGAIVNYFFKSNGLLGVLDSVYLLAPEAVSSAGNKRVIVVNSAIENPQFYTGGVVEKLGLLQNFLKADLVKTREHIDIARGEAKKLALGFKQRAKVVKKQAQEKAQVVTEQAQQKVEDFRTQSKEKKNRKTQATTDEFSTKIQQVTIEAKEKIDGVKSQGIKIFNSSKYERDKNINDR